MQDSDAARQTFERSQTPASAKQRRLKARKTRIKMNTLGKWNAVRNILMKDWDPIGIKEFQECQDEYDAYIPKILEFISGENKRENLEKYLSWIEEERMGLEFNQAYASAAIAKLISICSNIE